MTISRWIACLVITVVLLPAVALAQLSEIDRAIEQAQDLYDQGRYRQALPFAEEALKLAENKYGPEHSKIVEFLDLLVTIYESQMRYEEAENIYSRAQAIRNMENDFKSLLAEAVLLGNAEQVEYLIVEGADVNADFGNGSTPLHLAAKNGHTTVVALLIASGADVNAGNDDGATPLHLAAYGGHTETAKILVANGSNINAVDNEDRLTPLHVASFLGEIKLAEFLIQNSADLNAADNDGFTPVQYAGQRGHKELVELLKAAVARSIVVIRQGPEEAEPIEEEYRGIHMIALRSSPRAEYDIRLVGLDQGLAKLREALDYVYQKSAFSGESIDELKNSGLVILLYDPDFPYPEYTNATLALFCPGVPLGLRKFYPQIFEIYENAREGELYLAVFGRYISKHERHEIAIGVVHELVGHGLQFKRGRTTGIGQPGLECLLKSLEFEDMSLLDVECEAGLYELKGRQDFKVDMFTKEVIENRQVLEEYYCDDFKKYMGKHQPELVQLWNKLNVDVPRLLEIFEEYLIAQYG